MKTFLFLISLATAACLDAAFGIDTNVLHSGPLAIVGALMAAASAASGAVANNQAKNAMESDVEAELKRQEDYQNRADAPVKKLIDTSTVDTANKETAEGAAKLSDLVGQAAARPLSFAPRLSESSSTVGVSRTGDSNARSTQNFAKLGGYYNWLLNQGERQGRSAQELDTIGRFANISNSILPLELDNSSHTGDGLRNASQMLSTASSLANTYGATKVPVTTKTVKPPATTGTLAWGNVPQFSLSQMYANALNPNQH
jgi:hypothetical protein